MHETSKPQRESVEQLIDRIEADGWVVEEYDADVDPYTPGPTVTLSATKSAAVSVPVGGRDAASDAILTALDQTDRPGLPPEALVDAVTERDGVEETDARGALETLHDRDGIHTDQDGRVRKTL